MIVHRSDGPRSKSSRQKSKRYGSKSTSSDASDWTVEMAWTRLSCCYCCRVTIALPMYIAWWWLLSVAANRFGSVSGFSSGNGTGSGADHFVVPRGGHALRAPLGRWIPISRTNPSAFHVNNLLSSVGGERDRRLERKTYCVPIETIHSPVASHS